MAKDVFKKLNMEQKALQRRAAINNMNRHGTNLFFDAIESGKLEEVQKLFREGARLDARTTARGTISSMMGTVPYAIGATPLHAACLLGSPDIVAFLIEKGADVNARDNEGQTPMDYAILGHGYYEAEFNRKLSSRFSFQSTVDRAQTKVEDYESLILTLQRRSAKPGMFAIPEKFRVPSPDAPPPPPKPPAL